MKTPKSNAGKGPAAFWQMGLIVLVLAVLFFRSFLPQYVHFNNDGPLGQQNAAWLQLPNAFFGTWNDGNDTGFNGGYLPLDVSMMLKWSLGPVGFAKFFAPAALLIMGLGVWAFFRALKLTPLASTLGAIAMMLSATFFAGACWSVAEVEVAVGMDFIALALITANTSKTPWPLYVIRAMLAGLCVGINVIESADIGALCSIYVAIYVVCHSLFNEEGSFVNKAVRGIGSVAIVALLAGVIAAQTIISLIGVNVTGIAGTAQDAESRQARWDFATQWSLPKKETLGLVVPGLFGYRVDTPKDMSPLFQSEFEHGAYWGAMGRTPSIDRYFDSGGEEKQPAEQMRFGYGGYYCGILVVLLAFWTIAQAWRKENSLFTESQKKFIWFWAGVGLVSLLFAWGRFAPIFYGTLYKLPYFSTIRSPSKFVIFFCWAAAVLFAYGIHALNRRYMEVTGPKSSTMMDQLSKWWNKATSFDRKWTFACLGTIALAIISWLIFHWKLPDFIVYLQKVGFSDDNPDADNSASGIAAFSIHQAAWFIGLLLVAVALVTLVISGYFSGPRARPGMILLAAFMIFDLGRADLPWVIHWDYKNKYEVGSLNPVVDFLRQQPYEHRVAVLPMDPQQQLRGYDYLFSGLGLYRIEWAQHHFPYYNIESLDLIQMPRMPEDMKSYLEAFSPHSLDQYPLVARHWELTNTKYLLGAAGFLNALNEQLDPGKGRFRIVQRFDVVTKPGVVHPSELENFTVVTNNDGDLALFDFTGALPRAKLYGNWQVNTNDAANLKTLADLSFDPAKTVLVSTPDKSLAATATNGDSGTVEYKSYTPTHIVLAANATTPSVLLLNDKYDAQWKVTVDGQPADLLRCNFLMRGVYLQPGQHTVIFHFGMPDKWRPLTLGSLALIVLLTIALCVMSRKQTITA